MRYPNCKKKVDKNMQFYSKGGGQIKKYNKKKSFVISMLIVGLLIVTGVIIQMLYANGEGNISESDFEDYVDYDNQFLEKEVKYFNDKGYVRQEDIPQLLDEVEKVVKKGKTNGIIENYTRDSGNIYIKFSSGIKYLFIPLEEGKLSSGEGGKILTVEPVEDTFGIKKERLVTFIDKYFNKLEYTGSFTPVGDANLIKKAYNDIYEYDSLTLDMGSISYKYALKNNEVTIDSMKKWSENKVIIFEGHGAYNTELHSCLVTGESFLGFKDFSKYKDDIEKNNIVLTSFPKIPGTNISYSPVRQYCITSNFVHNYFGEMDNSLIFLGACSSVKDDVFAQELLNKGAAIVMGYNETTSMEYEMMTRSMFFYELTREHKQGECTTVAQALDYAKKSIASSDPLGGYGAELVCISKNKIQDRYTLKEMKNEHTNQVVSNGGFADQYYEQLIAMMGLADEHIETKIETETKTETKIENIEKIESKGARTVCLVPEKANLGIIFKGIADFDGNGIDDLIVIALNEYEGNIFLDQSVYFFDAEGNHTVKSSSNTNPITCNCNYYFYMVGNNMVIVYKADKSGEWIDGLWYTVIENNIQMHEDEINIMNYGINAPNNGKILYINKDYRYPDSVCYTIDDIDAYYVIYSKGFSLSSSDDRCLESESEGCDYINSLLSGILCEEVGQIKPTSWDNRWNTNFFPSVKLPESYTILKISVSPSYKTGEKTTESDVVIEAEYVNSRSVR